MAREPMTPRIPQTADALPVDSPPEPEPLTPVDDDFLPITPEERQAQLKEDLLALWKDDAFIAELMGRFLKLNDVRGEMLRTPAWKRAETLGMR